MTNYSGRSISSTSLKHDSFLLIPVRQAYMEIAHGINPNYDRWMKKWDSNNYTAARLACTIAKTHYGYLPKWRKNSKVPAWLSQALAENRRSFGEYWN